MTELMRHDDIGGPFTLTYRQGPRQQPAVVHLLIGRAVERVDIALAALGCELFAVNCDRWPNDGKAGVGDRWLPDAYQALHQAFEMRLELGITGSRHVDRLGVAAYRHGHRLRVKPAVGDPLFGFVVRVRHGGGRWVGVWRRHLVIVVGIGRRGGFGAEASDGESSDCHQCDDDDHTQQHPKRASPPGCRHWRRRTVLWHASAEGRSTEALRRVSLVVAAGRYARR